MKFSLRRKNQEPNTRSHRMILAILTFSTLLPSLAISSVNLTLPILATQLDVSFSNVQWLTIAYMLSLTSTLVIAGKVIDAKGQKKVLIIGLMIFIGASIALGTNKELYYLIFFRAIQGIGGAMLIAVNMVIASKTFEKNKVGSAIGLIGSMSAIGTGAGPVVASFLIEYWSWQSVFLINIPIATAILIFALYYLPANKTKTSQTINYKATLLFLLTIAFTTTTLKTTESGFGSFTLILTIVSVGMLAAFVTYERQTNQPLFNVETLKEPTLVISLFTNFLIANVAMISIIISPFYLTLALQLSIVETGFVMIASPVTVVVFAFLSGKLANKMNLDNLVLVGITVITLGAVWMTQITASDGTIAYIIGLVTMGSGYATFTSANNTLTMLKVDSSNKGLLSGTLSLSRNLGLMIGATISSNLYSFITGLSQQADPNPLLLSDGVNMVYFVALLALLSALSIQFFNKQTKDKNQIKTA
ncbi:MFS transporter [Pseudoalteromonas phenolica]|uniref:MFS transporter n=1 Tax=Pseudoalteromonas phenolica TaxID=161398 RepID=UPI00110B5A21|nr:MFS transporter [Pseudoalteromonas phenolica]TMO57010.1 hypothetical protein CWC21_03730 [Pseudoalteromonas phenolica]